MKNLKMKIIVPLLLLALTGIGSSFLGLVSLKNLGSIGREIASEQVPVIIVLDSISANVEEMQQLLLTHSIMDTKDEKVSGLIQEQQINLGMSKGEQDNIYSNAVIIAGGMLIIILIIFAVGTIDMIQTVIRPTVGYERKLREITENINRKNGDLTQRIPVRTIDEIG